MRQTATHLLHLVGVTVRPVQANSAVGSLACVMSPKLKAEVVMC